MINKTRANSEDTRALEAIESIALSMRFNNLMAMVKEFKEAGAYEDNEDEYMDDLNRICDDIYGVKFKRC